MSTRGLLVLAIVVAGLSWVALRQKGLEDRSRFYRSEPLLGTLEPSTIERIFVDHTMTETYLGFENRTPSALNWAMMHDMGWNQTAAVPEPGTVTLLAGLALTLAARRRINSRRRSERA